MILMEVYMSGDKRAFTFEDNNTTFGAYPSEERFNKLLANKSFNFNGETFVEGYPRTDLDPKIPTENQSEEFAKAKERMKEYAIKRAILVASSD